LGSLSVTPSTLVPHDNAPISTARSAAAVSVVKRICAIRREDDDATFLRWRGGEYRLDQLDLIAERRGCRPRPFEEVLQGHAFMTVANIMNRWVARSIPAAHARKHCPADNDGTLTPRRSGLQFFGDVADDLASMP
jgi:hypothetical protein